MSTKLLLFGGKAVAVYDDRLLPLLEALGSMAIARETNVEFDEVSQKWVATHIFTGMEISRDSRREKVIQDEIAWIEGRLNVTHC